MQMISRVAIGDAEVRQEVSADGYATLAPKVLDDVITLNINWTSILHESRSLQSRASQQQPVFQLQEPRTGSCCILATELRVSSSDASQQTSEVMKMVVSRLRSSRSEC